MLNYAPPSCKDYNFAPPSCTLYKDGDDTYDRIDDDNPCVMQLYKSLVTSTITSAGGERGFYPERSWIQCFDRLVWACNSNKSKGPDGYKKEIDPFCKAAGISLDEMHLIPALLLTMSVISLVKSGKRPTIVSVGAESRDNIFNSRNAMITPFAIFAGWYTHPQQLSNEAFLRSSYTPQAMSEMSQSVNRSYVPFIQLGM